APVPLSCSDAQPGRAASPAPPPLDALPICVAMAGFTVIVTSLNADSCVSLAVRRRMYVPAWSNVAVVSGLDALAKATTPGPLALVHVVVTVAPAANPSSDTVPLSDAPAGTA